MPRIHAAAAVAIAVCAVTGLSACGGDSRPYDEVPASTPALVPPEDADSVAGDVTTPTTTTAPAPDAGADSGVDTGGTDCTDTGGGTGGDIGGGTGGDTGGGGAAPDTGGITPD